MDRRDWLCLCLGVLATAAVIGCIVLAGMLARGN